MKTLRHWTREEDKLLEENYRKYGTKGLNNIPDRTYGACRLRAHRLGLMSTRASWTKEDDDIIKQYYPTIGGSVFYKMKGRHTMDACYARASILGVKRFNNIEENL